MVFDANVHKRKIKFEIANTHIAVTGCRGILLVAQLSGSVILASFIFVTRFNGARFFTVHNRSEQSYGGIVGFVLWVKW
jgi:hypothetical protein